jgi:hypothetical protein
VPDVTAPPFATIATPEHVLALQRTVGNRATTAVLQRTKKGAGGTPEPITPNDVTLAGGGQPTVSGNVHAALIKVGPGHTRVYGPAMSVTATVELAAGVELATDLTVGYIQNMTKGDRIAVYTTDGTPAGAVVAEQHMSVMPGRRDAEAHFKQDQNKNFVVDKQGNPIVEADAGPPWYASPNVLVTGGAKSLEVKASDTPSFPVALETENASGKKGKLAMIRGGEAFEIALAVKDGANAPINLSAATWGIDWTMTIDPALHTGTGKAGAPPQPIDKALVKPGAGLTHDDKLVWWAPVDDAEADAMPLHALLRSLPTARQYDGTVYQRIVNSIHRRSNPTCWHAHVLVDEDDSYTGGDYIVVSMEGVRGAKTKPAVECGTGENFWADWELYDLFDPHDVTTDSKIKVTIARQGQKAQERTWSFPWGDTEARKHAFSGDSKYRMSMGLH